MNDSCQHLLIARFNATPEDLLMLQALVKGDIAPLEELPSLTNTSLLRKYLKILDEELAVGSLEDAIVNRIAARDSM